ncbi:MAG: 3-keto-disaccharide hydrolase [Planctomycetales bacterium]|jgi:hypothetical protein
MITRCSQHGVRLLIAVSLIVLSGHIAVSQDAPDIPPRKGRSSNIRLFNGKDLSGWIGDQKYWSVEDGEIVGRNTESLSVSTYLLTEVDFSDFRLTFDFKLAQSEMHSGIALWGKVDSENGDEFAYVGPLVMFPSNYGIWDLYGREKIHDNADKAKAVGHQHDWNRIEILAQGNRIRTVLNGTLITDWRDPEPDRLVAGPIGLQLHSNKVPQEVRFRKLLLETFPEDRLTTLPSEERIETVGIRKLVLNVAPDSPEVWTRYHEVVIPDGVLAPVRRLGFRQRTAGFQPAERDPYYALLQKVRELDLSTMKKAAGEFRRKRQTEAFKGKYKDRPAYDFPDFVDLYDAPDLYHGKLVTLQGHLRKLSSFSPDENPYGIEGQLWEGWLYDPHGQNHPAVIISTSRDDSLEEGTELVADHVTVTGYFFKNYGYEGQDAFRFAPMLIAQKIEQRPPAASINPFNLGLSAKMQLLVAAVATLMVGRFGLRVWKHSKADEQKRRETRDIASTEEAEPTFDNIVDTGGVPEFPTE